MEKKEKEKKKGGKLLSIFLLLVVIVVTIFLYAKYTGIKGLIVKEYRVKSEILTNNFSGLKIIHFSDLLYKSTVDKEDVKNLIKIINELKPDIVVFTGDLINKNAKINNEDIEFLEEDNTIYQELSYYLLRRFTMSITIVMFKIKVTLKVSRIKKFRKSII